MKTSGKRAQFVTIQNEHVVASAGYITPPLRTGYEGVVAHRVDDLFAYTAKEDGEIVELSKKHVKIKYASGKVAAVELGVRYGTVKGKTIPHEVVCDLAVGSKVSVGDVITYNTGYFQRDILNKKQVLLKTAILAKTAILEQAFTFEDASVISERAAKLLDTNKTHVRTIIVRFDQTLRDMVKVGTDVELETILCTIEDSVTADNDLFDEESLDALKLMSSNTPTAKHVGKVEKIEVLYHGDLEDMSPSLRALAEASDKERVRLAKQLGKPPVTGQVDATVRVGSDPLDVDTAAIRVYITETLSAGVGDKGVFGNQLKTVFSNVMTGINRTESGEDLDAFFAYTSISNRIVLSPEIMGTTITLLKLMSKRVAKTYFAAKG